MNLGVYLWSPCHYGATILRKWMPFFKAAANGTGVRASEDTTWEQAVLATLRGIWEGQLGTKHNDKVKQRQGHKTQHRSTEL